MNEQLIEEIDVFRGQVMDQLSNRNVVTFRLGDLDFDGELSVADSVISKTALTKILTALRVKDTFFKYRNDMNPDDWEEVKRVLKDANQNTTFWGKKIITPDGFQRITELYPRNEIINDSGNILNNNFENYFNYLQNAISTTQVPFEAKNLYFDPEHEIVDIKLVAGNGEVDLFQNGADIWKPGANLTWDSLKFSSAPFFERLVCSNGMTADQMGFKANLQNKKFNLKKIEAEIGKLIIAAPDKFNETIQFHSAHLKDVNLSLNEFYDFKNFFKVKNNDDERYDHIMMKVFNETDIYKHYAVDISTKSKKWLSTADSGRNAYDFFNDMTYLASHTDEVNLEESDARELRIKAGSLFFKKELDLEDVAPNINISVSKIFED